MQYFILLIHCTLKPSLKFMEGSKFFNVTVNHFFTGLPAQLQHKVFLIFKINVNSSR